MNWWYWPWIVNMGPVERTNVWAMLRAILLDQGHRWDEGQERPTMAAEGP